MRPTIGQGLPLDEQRPPGFLVAAAGASAEIAVGIAHCVTIAMS